MSNPTRQNIVSNTIELAKVNHGRLVNFFRVKGFESDPKQVIKNILRPRVWFLTWDDAYPFLCELNIQNRTFDIEYYSFQGACFSIHHPDGYSVAIGPNWFLDGVNLWIEWIDDEPVFGSDGDLELTLSRSVEMKSNKMLNSYKTRSTEKFEMIGDCHLHPGLSLNTLSHQKLNVDVDCENVRRIIDDVVEAKPVLDIIGLVKSNVYLSLPGSDEKTEYKFGGKYEILDATYQDGRFIQGVENFFDTIHTNVYAQISLENEIETCFSLNKGKVSEPEEKLRQKWNCPENFGLEVTRKYSLKGDLMSIKVRMSPNM